MGVPPMFNTVLCIVMLVSWAVMLGGAAAWFDEVDNLGDAGERQLWWPVWFEFFLLLVFVICIVMGKIDEWKGVLVAFAAMASAYLMPVAENWLVRVDYYDGGNDTLHDISNASAAGTIMVIIVNWICIILYGNDSFREALQAKAEALNAESAGEPVA